MAKRPKKPGGDDPKAAPETAGADDHVSTVAIGASAGGLAALQALFGALPADLGVAYVVISHLNPDNPSELAGILQRNTKMPVAEVDKPARLERDRVYIIPPNLQLVVHGETISAEPFTEPRGQRAPIDHFFRSIGEEHGDGFAVVLSGGGSDGSVGLKAVKENGGLILVQDPADAEFPSMPRAAIATGLADVVLPVKALAERLAELVRNKKRIEPPDADVAETQLEAILGYLRTRTGHDFSRYKRATVMRRLTRRMHINRISDLADYVAILRGNTEEVAALFSDLLISVTTFFRDRDAFETLEEQVIPAILETMDQDEPVRVWVPGCATGEEAYSLAILLLEASARKGVRPEIQIFATDLDPGVLAIAREGRYPRAIEADVSEERLQRFFNREGDHYRIKREVRDLMVFAAHSLLKDPPFSKLDLISCRNLLMYMERDLQTQVFGALHYALKPGRYLFLGSAEAPDTAPGEFRAMDRKQRIFQAVVRSTAPTLPRLLIAPQAPVLPAARPAARGSAQVESAVHLKALEEHAPPSALVDEDHRIVHLSEGAGRFLHPPGGAPSTTITQIARHELRLDVRVGLHRAFDKNEPTLSLPIPMHLEGAPHRVLVAVRPISREKEPRRLALVMFIDGGPFDPAGLPPETLEEASDKLVHKLQQELILTRERLMGSREEYEATNEELHAANEELQSINEEYRSTAEELETSKEELQSMNEELQTLNAELKVKYEGVSRAHNDLLNLLAATEVGTLFLDTQLRIKRFTPKVAEVFNITPSDEGRPITDFTHRLNYDHLARDAQKILEDLTPQELEVESKDGRWHLMRLRPYRTVQDRIDGVIVVFVDITERRRQELRLQQLTSELDHRVKNILSRMTVLIDRSQRPGQTAKDLATTLKRRVQSMSDTHALLSRGKWTGASLKQICTNELGVYAQGDNVSVTGADVTLTAAAAQSFSTVIHELTTNAVKHGALSKSGGRVNLELAVRDGRTLVLIWEESDGPPVKKPSARNYGLTVIEEQLGYEFGGKVSATFDAAGFHARIETPLEKVASAN